MNLTRKLAIASLAVLPAGGAAAAMLIATAPTAQVQLLSAHTAAPARSAPAPATDGDVSTEAGATTADPAGGPNVQQGPDVQQGGPDAAAGSPREGSSETAAAESADPPGGANLQQGSNLQQ